MLACGSVSAAQAKDDFVYFGTNGEKASEGIYISRFDPESGALAPAVLAAKTTNPVFIALHPNHRTLYAIGESPNKDGFLASFAIEAGTGKLSLLNSHPSGAGPLCYVSIDQTGRTALGSSYRDGYVVSFPIQDDGSLRERTSFSRHTGVGVNKLRQQGPHEHCIDLDPANRFALVADHGLDKVYTYRFDPAASTLTEEPDPYQAKPGAAPRHLAFDRTGRIVYLVNELASTLSVLAYDPDHGRLTEKQVLPLLPADFKSLNTAAEVVVHPSGKYVYASNRGHNSIALFTVAPDTGLLTFVEFMREGINHPRHFAIDPSGRWLLCANRDANTVTVYRIDPETGRLTATAAHADVPVPTCIQFLLP